MLRFCDNSFSENYFSTIGVDFKIKSVSIDNSNAKLQVWDTAGQERFQTITTSYYHNANGIAVVYDITNRESFEAVNKWFKDVDRLASPDVCRILIGNKDDMNDVRTVNTKEGQDLAAALGVPFLETSAKSSHNVDDMFMMMGKAIKEKKSGKSIGTGIREPVKIVGRSVDQSPSGGYCQC